MTQLPKFRFGASIAGSPITLSAAIAPSPVEGHSKKQARTKIWELSPNVHCSIIGTCLTGFELRQYLKKIDKAGTKTITDHGLHGRGVMAAGRADTAGKMLQKTLDRRHETVIKRFSKMKTVNEVRALWRECFDEACNF